MSGLWVAGGRLPGQGEEGEGLSLSSRSPCHSLAGQRPVEGVKLGSQLGCWCQGGLTVDVLDKRVGDMVGWLALKSDSFQQKGR